MDVQLIQACIKEDRRAQEQFYRICYEKFIGTAYRYAVSKEQAVYFFNLGFVKLLMNLKQFDINNPFEYWAKRVLINTILNELNKEKREREKHVPIDEPGKLPYTDSNADDELVAEKIGLIREKVQQLPPMTRSVFNMYAFDGYKHREIADLLGITENTSMWHYSDAKKRIKVLLNIV